MYEEDLIKEFKKANLEMLNVMFNDLNDLHPQFMFLMLDKDKEPRNEVIMAPLFFANKKLRYLFAVKTLPKIIEEYRENGNKILCISFMNEATATRLDSNKKKIEGTKHDVLRITFETETDFESHTWDVIKGVSGKRYLGKQTDFKTVNKREVLQGIFVNLL
jgi:hypothetical protein